MKKIYLLLVLLSTFCFGQVFNNETFDNTGWGAPYSNTYPITFSGNYTITNVTTNHGSGANSMPSNYPNASGGNYVKLFVVPQTTTFQSITINNINTNNGLTNKLKFGVYFGMYNPAFIPNLLIEQSVDNTNWSTVNYIAPPYNIWVLAITTTNLINSDNLTIRFTFYPNQPTTTNYYNVLLDDIKIESTVGINDYSINKTLIYPNPTNDLIDIKLNNLNIGRIKITNILGQELFNDTFNSDIVSLSLKEYGTKGVNLLSIYDTDNKLITTKKIVLN